MFDLNSFDKTLEIKKRINGEQLLIKPSKYERGEEFEILNLSGKYIGSGYWLKYKLHSMDSRRVDFINETMDHNRKVSSIKEDFSGREIAEYSFYGQKIII